MISRHIKDRIQSELNCEIKNISSVHGGDINEAAHVTLDSGDDLFVKWNESAPPNMFETEAKGLELLKSAETNLQIPAVKLINEKFLVLDWIHEGGGKKKIGF